MAALAMMRILTLIHMMLSQAGGKNLYLWDTELLV